MSTSEDLDALLVIAADWLQKADALIVAAGAGMGVDSGLPDFRGNEGFWRAYPPYAKLGLRFVELANPDWFRRDPTLAWGFYGHRMNLYRGARPHPGFGVLRNWIASMPAGGFVFTSNVDGHFQKAGFDGDRIVEVHGAGDWMQCLRDCGVGVFEAAGARHAEVSVDESTMRAIEPLPSCPRCGALARPNILMFGDWEWDSSRYAPQQARLSRWMHEVAGSNVVVVECGAGLAVPTVRRFSEDCVHELDARLIRINVREPEAPAGQIGLAVGALAALQALESRRTQSKDGSIGAIAKGVDA